MNVLLALMLVASAATTWGVIRLGRRLWALVSGAWANKCPHYSWFGVCASCAYDRRDAEARQRMTGHWERDKGSLPAYFQGSSRTSLPGAAEGGSPEGPPSPERPDDDWFNEH